MFRSIAAPMQSIAERLAARKRPGGGGCPMNDKSGISIGEEIRLRRSAEGWRQDNLTANE